MHPTDGVPDEPISVRSRIGDNWHFGSCRCRNAVLESMNHDSPDANDAYLSRAFSVNDDSSAGPSRAGTGTGLLEVHGVTVRFGGLTALDDVSLAAAPRQVTGIIGPNGAGKTTLLNVLCGFVRPASGTIRFDTHELTGARPHRLAGLGIARTLQGVGLFRGRSAVENVMVGATPSARAGFWSGLFGLPWSDRDERRLREHAMQALSRVGAAD